MTKPLAPKLRPGDPHDELVALVALISQREANQERIATALDFVGSAVDILENPSILSTIDQHELLEDESTGSVVELAQGMVHAWRSRGLDVRSVLDPRYPQALQEVFDKPPMVFVAGTWDESLDDRAVAVVGTRGPSQDGLRRADRIARSLAKQGVTVLSGLAKGIDAAVHSGALAAGGRTVAVMGTGIDQRYPAENRGLADQILASGGALISQFLPDQGPRPWTFPKRNVTMSGLGVATIVIEASETSGTRIQARVALRHGRRVFLPSTLIATHAWARKLVSEGIDGARAIEVRSTDEVLDLLQQVEATSPVTA